MYKNAIFPSNVPPYAYICQTRCSTLRIICVLEFRTADKLFSYRGVGTELIIERFNPYIFLPICATTGSLRQVPT